MEDIRQTIEDGIKAWLELLGGAGVGGGRVGYRTDKDATTLQLMLYLPSSSNPQSYYKMNEHQKNVYRKIPPQFNIEGTAVNKLVVFHELGNMFGLNDTYYNKKIDDKLRQKYIDSGVPPEDLAVSDVRHLIDDKDPTKLQPPSVMAMDAKDENGDGLPDLYDDDKNGIWEKYEMHYGSDEGK